MKLFDGSVAGFRIRLPEDWIVVDLTDSRPVPRGGHVLSVAAESPADGLILPGDVILGVDGAATVEMDQVQDKIVTRVPGDTLTLRIDRLDPETLTYSEIDVEVTLGEHPERGGPFLGIQFQTAFIRPEFNILEGTVPEAELTAYMFSASEVDKLVAVAPSGRPALGISAGSQAPLPEYAVIQDEYVRLVQAIGGEVTLADMVTIAGLEALRIQTRQPTVYSGPTSVVYHAVRTDSQLFTLQFFSADLQVDGGVIADIVESFEIVG